MASETSLRHVGIERSHDLVAAVDHAHVGAPSLEGLGHLETDVATTDHHDSRHFTLLRFTKQGVRVVEGGDAPHERQVDPGQRGPQRASARPDREQIEGLVDVDPGFEVACVDHSSVEVDADDLVTQAGVDAALAVLVW